VNPGFRSRIIEFHKGWKKAEELLNHHTPMKTRIFYLCILVFLSACTRGRSVHGPPIQLRCEYEVDPLGIDVEHPRLFWVVNDRRQGANQTAYRILVSEDESSVRRSVGDIWDSGKVTSNQSIQVVYDGASLVSGKRYYWTVQTWDNDNRPSVFSESAWWEMGLLEQDDWDASWIGDGSVAPVRDEDFYRDIPAPLFRKPFEIGKTVERARLYISGLGYYEAYLNGTKAGDRVLDPGWTNYGKRVQYSTYDVTDLLQEGDNVIGVMLGNGWYNPLPMRLFSRWNLREILTIGQPGFIAHLRIYYSDGTEAVLTSDETWKTTEGPILRNNVYLGEKYDARREQPGWDQPGFDDSTWKSAVRAEAPAGRLVAQIQPPIRITRTLQPVAVTEPEPGTFVVDMGQNFAGWIRMRVQGPASTEVKLRYGELLFDDGALNGLTTVACQIKEMWNTDGGPGAPKTAWQEDTYILKGVEEEFFQQHFTFHGFRYIEVKGYPGTPTVDDFTGLRLNADLESAGSIDGSNDLFNRIQEMLEWTFLSNVFSVQSDCPAREKFGYGGDIVAVGESYLYNYNMANFYTKTVRDFQDDVRPNGGMPETAPFNGIQSKGLGEGSGPIGWQVAHPYLQLLLYRFYGDKRLIEEQYPTTRRLIEFLRTRAGNHFIDIGISDHESVDPKPEALTSTAFYFHHVKLMAEFAGILGYRQDAEMYRLLVDSIKTAFVDRFLDPSTGRFDSGTQGAQAFALWYDLVPEESKQQSFERLIDEVVDRHQGHLSTGIFGIKMTLDVLRRYNRSDMAYQMADQRTYPGWGWMLENDATTFWESWAGEENAPSHNHPMFGSVGEWFFRSLAGINPAVDAVGFDRLIIRPQGIEKMESFKGHYDSIRGTIRSDWRKEDGTFYLDVEIPANTEALIYVPLTGRDSNVVEANGSMLIEDGETVGLIPGLSFERLEEEYAVFRTGGGTYSLKVEG